MPAASQLAAVLLIVGTAGVGNCAALLKDADATEVQVALPEVTVYDVPATIPLINPPAPTVGPAGLKV